MTLSQQSEVLPLEISQKRAMLLMCLCAFLWSIGGLFIKLLPWNAAAICGVRSSISALIILLYMAKMKYRLTLKNPMVWLAGLGLMGTMLLFVSANKLTTSANAIVLQSTAPLYIMVISALFFRAHYSRREYVLVAITMGGDRPVLPGPAYPRGTAGQCPGPPQRSHHGPDVHRLGAAAGR